MTITRVTIYELRNNRYNVMLYDDSDNLIKTLRNVDVEWLV